MYKVSEVFNTIQGEGSLAGTPSAFVRLYGCSVGCPWCDTPYSWKLEPREVTFEQLQRAEPEYPLFAVVSANELASWCNAQPGDHVVITGGEPLEHDLTLLLSRIRKRRQVETSGTVLAQPYVADMIDWLTVSPKFDMPGGKKVELEMLLSADEIKHPVGRERDIENLLEALPGVDCPVYVQPISQSPKATALCIDAAAKYGWRVSIQAHKYAGLR
jgi:7-carboxy-7-deazaguanine synthase